MTDQIPSHHRPGGGFQNPWGPGSQQARFGQFLKWALFERPRTTRRRTPDRATFAAAHQPVAPSFSIRESPDTLAITWIGHSSFLIQIAGQKTDHFRAGHVQQFRLLLHGELGFAGHQQVRGKAARRRIFGLRFHLLGDPHALEQFCEINATGAAGGRLAIGDRFCGKKRLL